MTLSDLLVSFKQVEPVRFEQFNAFNYDPFANIKRIQRVVNNDPLQSEFSNEEQLQNDEKPLNWSVSRPTISPKQSVISEPITENQESKPVTESQKQKPNTESQKPIIPQPPTTKISNKNDWAAQMEQAYRNAGITNDNIIKALIAKNALESGWGKYTQGSYNFGNITTGSNWKGKSVKGKDHNADGKPITQNFRSYNSLQDYVDDEIQFLTRLYDFNQNDDFETFIFKLQGGNKGKRKYAEARDYIKRVRSVYNSI